MDDVINVTGHRLGTAEVEDALVIDFSTVRLTDLLMVYLQDKHPAVAEAAVVGFPHDLKGEGVYAYVILKRKAMHDLHEHDLDEGKLTKELQQLVRTQIAGYAVPEKMQVSLSGRLMQQVSSLLGLHSSCSSLLELW